MNRRRTAASLALAGALLAAGWAMAFPTGAVAVANAPYPAETLYVPPPVSCAPTGPPLCVPGPRPSHRVRPSATGSPWAPPAPAAGSGSDSRALPGTGYRLLAEVGMGLLLLVAGGALVLLGRESRLRRQEGER